MTRWHPGSPGTLNLAEHIESRSPRQKDIWEWPLWKLALYGLLGIVCWAAVAAILLGIFVAAGW